jgi:hypothetical protein
MLSWAVDLLANLVHSSLPACQSLSVTVTLAWPGIPQASHDGVTVALPGLPVAPDRWQQSLTL